MTEEKSMETINFDKIGITDDVMFGSVFRNKDDCKEFLQRIMDIEISELHIVEEQKSLKIRFMGKGVRIDVYVRDKQGNSYDIEMQISNTHELELRSRYYHGEMDSYQIKQGQKYKNLKRSVVIFVCGFDMFQENRSIYTFETVCRQNPSIVLNDKRITYFVNIHGDRNDMDQNTVNLLDYFKTGEPTDPYTRRLQQQVERIRSDDEWRENYMTFEMKLDQRFEDGKQLGRAEGEKNRDRNLILKWVQKGKTVSEMAEDLEKPEDYVRELMK